MMNETSIELGIHCIQLTKQSNALLITNVTKFHTTLKRALMRHVSIGSKKRVVHLAKFQVAQYSTTARNVAVLDELVAKL